MLLPLFISIFRFFHKLLHIIPQIKNLRLLHILSKIQDYSIFFLGYYISYQRSRIQKEIAPHIKPKILKKLLMTRIDFSFVGHTHILFRVATLGRVHGVAHVGYT